MLNLKKLAVLTLPTFLRKPLLTALVESCVSGLQDLPRRVADLEDETQVALRRNGQVCRLRGLLNDLFDPVDRGIRIVDAEEAVENRLLWTRDEERWVYVPEGGSGEGLPVYVRQAGGASRVDFEVHLPWQLEKRSGYDQLVAQVAAVTRRYRLAGKRFVVVQDRMVWIRPTAAN